MAEEIFNPSNTIAYLNGQFLPLEEAKVSPMDRGFLFGDGVYEVIPVYQGKLFGLKEHIDRLNQSLQGIKMTPVMSHVDWAEKMTELVKRNNAPDCSLYIQVTRGNEWIRTHKIPTTLSSTIFAVCFPKVYLDKAALSQGFNAVTVKDIRWKLCNVKTTARLAYVLMYQEAVEAGAEEAIIFQNGCVLEGTVSNIFIVRHGVIITPPKSSQILSGITRDKVLLLAEKNRIPYRENKITERDLEKADECFITSSTRGLTPIVKIDGHPIGNGTPGPVWSQMWDLFSDEVKNLG